MIVIAYITGYLFIGFLISFIAHKYFEKIEFISIVFAWPLWLLFVITDFAFTLPNLLEKFIKILAGTHLRSGDLCITLYETLFSIDTDEKYVLKENQILTFLCDHEHGKKVIHNGKIGYVYYKNIKKYVKK
jgi:hypothetical protein